MWFCTGCKQVLEEVSLKEGAHPSCTILLPPSWDLDVMAGTQVVIPGNEIEATYQE